MKLIKALALVAFVAATVSLGACSSKQSEVAPAPASSYGYSK